MRSSQLLSGALLAAVAQAQQGAWAQCGGVNWTGQTTCIAGYTCTYSNDFYSQCLPGTAATTTAKSTTTTTTAKTTTTTSKAATTTTQAPSATGSWKWLGVNEAGAEFGQAVYPGTWGKEFIFPDNTAIDVRLPPIFLS
jgi:endoglucanase